ncbi:helicase C-terminal domain-containing protein [Pseudarthrobacter oxydans]|uniref:helicase C-terminal domain-containing protein n=1 Tax=Pseudarthrobacter oxydans TaxID=1671 RepID=UPI003427F129
MHRRADHPARHQTANYTLNWEEPNYVAEAWAVSLPSGLSAYNQMFDALAEDLDEVLIQRMTAPENEGTAELDVRLIPIPIIGKHKAALTLVLNSAVAEKDDLKWAVQRLLPQLDSCLFYVDRKSWYIRPMIPPTHTHAAFTEPIQRIYLSATMGRGGELERAFGRPSIAKIGVPDAWEKTGSGRRFVVFPSLVGDEPSTAGVKEGGEATTKEPLTKVLLDLARKRLVLAQNVRTTENIASVLQLAEDETYRVANGEFAAFADAETGTLLAANRYDGMDLADDVCRMMLIHGLPAATHLQDRFFESKLRARSVLQERLRTRVLQGLGRCTRGPQDYSVVVVEDEALVRFLSREENIAAMPSELQAELRFGLNTSENVTGSQLLSLTRSALVQDAKWAGDAENQIIEWREDSVVASAPELDSLAASAPREVRAWRQAWAGDWAAAGQLAMEIHSELNGTELTPYRSLWAYFAHCWLSRAADGGAQTREKAQEYLGLAHRASFGTTWLKELQQQRQAPPSMEDWEQKAVAAIHQKAVAGAARPTKSATELTQMVADLGQSRATAYERGLTTLGTCLGARAFKPEGDAKSDSVWIWERVWVTIEAKSEQLEGGTINPSYVRQVCSQLNSLAFDENAEDYPPGSISVMVSPKGVVRPAAVAGSNKNIYLVSPEEMKEVALDVKRAWSAIRTFATDTDSTEQIDETARVLWEHRLLPTQVYDRLTVEPVK